MSLSPRTFTLLLAMTPGIGSKSLLKVLARNDLLGRTPEEFLSLSIESYREDYGLTTKVSTYLAEHRKTLAKELHPLETRLETLGVRWTTVIDAGYPELLEQFDGDIPTVLFYYGNAKLLAGRTFSVLSSRNATDRELVKIEELTEAGVLAGEILVTGHDKPEYQRSAIVPLRWGAPRILCLDRGLFQVLGDDLKNEAFRTARLWRYEFDPQTDLAISPFRPDSGFIGANNRTRDKLVAGLSRRIEFVKVSKGGNMEKLLALAKKAGRHAE